jgi:membrane dipeptidase
MFLRRFPLNPTCNLLTVAAFVCAVSLATAADSPQPEISSRARAIHARAIVIDGHNDLPWKLRQKAKSSFDVWDIAKPVPGMHTDIPRLRKGGVGAQFWAAYVPADTLKKGTSVRTTMEQIDLIHRMLQRYPETFEWALTADAIESAHKRGKIGSLIGVEGGHSIDGSLGVLRTYYTLGVRYMTLTHSDTLAWADSSTDVSKSGGLSDFGREVVREMNRLGMLVDISHTSDDTVRDALEVSTAPIIASHSSARALANHVRCIPDGLLRAIGEKGGVVMVNFFSGYLVPESADYFADILEVNRKMRQEYPDEKEYEKARDAWRKVMQKQITEGGKVKPGTVKDVVNHIDHIVKVAGIDHVGLGGDYDGVSMLPEGMGDVSSYPLITQELLNRGYSEKDIHKILGGNTLRALRAAEKVAAKLR